MNLLKDNSTLVAIFASILVGMLFLILFISFVVEVDPAEEAFKQEVEAISLDGKVAEFEIVGRDHVEPGTTVDGYTTNPPTSGTHWTEAQLWGIYDEEIQDPAAVHGLEHGGIWVSYKDISEESITLLEVLQKDNKGSMILSPRNANETNIVVASWGRTMEVTESEDMGAVIQKYINTYKNDSPEKLAL